MFRPRMILSQKQPDDAPGLGGLTHNVPSNRRLAPAFTSP